MTLRAKTTLLGLYLSKFDLQGLDKLGFKSFAEAFNLMGQSIGAKPTTIKLYRDEFDPLFPNPRKGWHKRPMREFCKKYYSEFGELNIEDFSDLVKKIITKNYDLKLLKTISEEGDISGDSFLKRLVTGEAAENYFRNNFQLVSLFNGFDLEDTTMYGCGFDFKLSSPKSEHFYGVEVKGIKEKSGGILLTEKEYKIAEFMQDDYILFIVRNLKEKPFYTCIQNPLNSNLSFKKIERRAIQISYTLKI